MFKNYFKIAARNLWRNRVTSTVSILGLSVGLASGIVIFLLVGYLFSFNRCHSKSDRIFWVVTDIFNDRVEPTDVTPRPMGQVLRDEYSFVESAVRLNNVFGSVIGVPDTNGGMAKKFEESRNICFTEPEYLKVFDVEQAFGNPAAALATVNSVVLSQDYAKKYFGVENAVGRTLRLDNKVTLTVNAIVANPPSNTQLRYDVLISYTTIPGISGDPDMMQQWSEPSTMCWVALKPGIPASRLESALASIKGKYYNAKDAKSYNFRIIPLREMFHTPGLGPAPRPILYALIVVGLFLVVAACVNFVNLSTAQAVGRSKEVGVRKTMGSSRKQLIGQFMLEIALLCLFAFVVALAIAQVSLPALNSALSMLHADISVLDLFNANAIKWFVGLVLGVIFLAGLYPSAVIAQFNPVTALKGKLSVQKVGNFTIRKSLVVAQFFITQLFIIGVIVISAQVKYLKSKDPGFDKDAVLMVKLPSGAVSRQQTIVDRLAAINGVEKVALGAEPPMSQMRTSEPFAFNHRTENEKFPLQVRIGDMHYVPLFGLKLVAGRNFESDDTTRNEILVNEALVKQLGISGASEMLGKSIRLWGQERTVTGIVKDFNLDPLSAMIQPAVIVNYPKANAMAAVKVNPAAMTETLSEIERSWNDVFPENVYNATFLDEKINDFYVTENILLGLIRIFALIAVLIGCLGLYGLVTYMAESRSKEIGVRKVMGATNQQLLWIFGKEFARLLLIGFVLAAPAGWFLMRNWLQGYPYKIDLGWWVFAATAGLAAAVTILTISYQSMRAARIDPARSLRSE
jgi:putative ABC transport system permease protein